MAGDPQQKNKPELLCGVAPKIADGSVTDRVEQPPPGVLPECEERPHRFGLQLSPRLGTRDDKGKRQQPLGGFSHTAKGPGTRERGTGERKTSLLETGSLTSQPPGLLPLHRSCELLFYITRR